jgi:G protein-coupled receptor GPR1
MAPIIAMRNLQDALRLAVLSRDLGQHQKDAPPFSKRQFTILEALAVTFASFSLFASLVSFYWFLRMRRSFRHEYVIQTSCHTLVDLFPCSPLPSLIMLLIQSDMIKAVGFMLYPVIVFAQGPVTSDSIFCQFNGFVLSVGIEASGMVILLPQTRIWR